MLLSQSWSKSWVGSMCSIYWKSGIQKKFVKS
jgi:hypothetical protein